MQLIKDVAPLNQAMDDEFTKAEAIQAADAVIFQATGSHLRNIEIDVLAGAWEKKTYAQMAEALDYSEDYLNKDVGNKLWRKLSKALGESVSKSNFRAPLQRRLLRSPGTRTSMRPTAPIPGSIPYVERPPIEERCYAAIQRPGALLRIKAPQKMGKTWLMNRVLAATCDLGYQTVTIDLTLADHGVFSNLETFLQWICVNTADALDLEDELATYWGSLYGLSQNCTRYFQKHILAKVNCPLVLAFDNFDLLFEQTAIFEDFCMLLRGWHEKAKQNSKIGYIWQQLRLIVVNSTQLYPTLRKEHSPFNVGVAFELPEFNPAQVAALAQTFNLTPPDPVTGWAPLMAMVGGHPYLMQQAFTHLRDYRITLVELLAQAPTEGALYGDYLRQLLGQLQQTPSLKAAFRQVLGQDTASRLEAGLAFQLHSMGLIHLQGNDCVPSCHLYQRYFGERLQAEAMPHE